MSPMLHLDTHVVVWLYAGEHQRFPGEVRKRLAEGELVYSPMVRLELTFLYEVGKLNEPADPIIRELATSTGLRQDATALADVVGAAQALGFTRDPFDRLILGQAIAARSRLVTKDLHLRDASPNRTFWQ